MAQSAVANVSKVVEAAGVQVDELVLQPLASAEAVLSTEEKRQGVVIADIGGGCTDISVFLDGSIHHSATLPIGGNHVTRDLVVGMRCPYHSAEEAKQLFGHALASTVLPDDMIDVRMSMRRTTCESRSATTMSPLLSKRTS